MNLPKCLSTICAITGFVVFSSYASATPLACEGTDLKFTLIYDTNHKVTGVTEILAADAKLGQALEQSSNFFGPESTSDGREYLDANFPTPNGYYSTGNWTLTLNPKTGEAEFGFDDFDGDIRSIDVICR